MTKNLTALSFPWSIRHLFIDLNSTKYTQIRYSNKNKENENEKKGRKKKKRFVFHLLSLGSSGGSSITLSIFSILNNVSDRRND